MNLIEVEQLNKKNFRLRKSYNYIDKNEKIERLKAYNHEYYINKKQKQKSKWILYYKNNRQLIKQNNIERAPKRPSTFKKINKEVRINFN
tara:strand:+ start:541 stop:810 length:270 start_codon:yes stop_codon:yes gene_type:complete